MSRIEIDNLAQVTGKEAVFVDHHSLLNVLNLLERQIENLNAVLKLPELKQYSEFCVEILMALSRNGLEERVKGIRRQLIKLDKYALDLARIHRPHRPAIEGLHKTLEVAIIRIEEFQHDRYAWRLTNGDDMRLRLYQFLGAVEQVGGGQFHFVFSEDELCVDSYLIDFRIRIDEPFRCPNVLEDCIRDLVGNARKYSDPGTRIQVDVVNESPNGLRISVRDEGRGIPEAELEKVVLYGYRASNALDRKTMGGGYGLTKAYMVCKRYRGRFYVESPEDGGAIIEFTAFP